MGVNAGSSILHVFSSFEVGGAQVRFCDIANALGDRYNHTIIAMDGNFESANRLDPEIAWKKIPAPVVKSHGISFTNLIRFRRLLKTLQPNVLVTYHWGAIEWALVNRWRSLVPHIHFEDGFGPEESPTIQLRRRIYLRRIALGGNTRVIVPSQTLWNIATQCWALDTHRVRLIRNGVDCERFRKAADRSFLNKAGINSDSLVIGTVATLRPEKNLGRLINAVATLPSDLQATLVVAGDGPERCRLEQLAKNVGFSKRTHFLGSVQQPEHLYPCFDIFAMSSDTEQMPMSLLEAMASGLPIASTDVGDIAAVLPSENRSLMADCQNAESLAHQLSRLASDPNLRARLGMLNRERACNEFGFSKMVQSHQELLDA